MILEAQPLQALPGPLIPDSLPYLVLRHPVSSISLVPSGMRTFLDLMARLPARVPIPKLEYTRGDSYSVRILPSSLPGNEILQQVHHMVLFRVS